MKVETISGRQWDSFARRIERATLKACGRSLTAASISTRARHHIVEVRDDGDVLIVTPGWRDTMRGAPASEGG